MALATTIRQTVDQVVARSFPQAHSSHPRAPIRRSREKGVDYESQIPILISHKSEGSKTQNVNEVAATLQREIAQNLPEALESVVVSNVHTLHFKVW